MSATPAPPPVSHPRLARCARAALRLLGWRVRFDGMPGPRGVAIVYPHTSNWDFIIGLLGKWAIDVPVRFIGKETLFRGLTGATLGRLMRWWGGRPVDRHNASGAVEQMARLVESEPWCWLALSPEGTRRHVPHLRSGFWHLARRLDLPVALATLDWGRREIDVTRFVHMSGDAARDLAMLREHYAGRRGHRPAQAGTIAFRPEVGPEPGRR